MPSPKPTLPAFTPLHAHSSGQPLYRQAKRALLQAIEAGQYAPGAALPNETTLAGALGVSVGTLRHAVDELVDEHVLVRRQGRGTFVATHSSDRFLFQFFHVERSDGLREAPEVEMLAFERTRAGEEAAAALALRQGDPVIEVQNRLRLQGRPVVLDRITIAADLFRGLTEKRLAERPGTIYQFYQSEFGITVLRAQERARAVPADRAVARALGIGAGAPVMEVRRTALTFRERPVEYRVSAIDTSRHDYVHLLSAPAGRA